MAGTEIIDGDGRGELGEGGEVAAGEIDHVDEVANTGAVWGFVIVAKDTEL